MSNVADEDRADAAGALTLSWPQAQALHIAPPMRPTETLSERPPRRPRHTAPTLPESPAADEDTIDDFELISLLGQGSGGRVYLARERSLDRTVALKIVPNAGAEAHTLAQLEHENIVSVFSEAIEPELGRRLICMQYVPGTSLGKVLGRLIDRREDATGAAIIKAIDSLSASHAPLDTAQLRERAELERADAVTAVCTIGATLARALAHAHARDVVHNDVKPLNILLTPSGRPMLVDFNIASSPTHHANPVGVTMSYAAPEQLRAFAGQAPRGSVDARADLYSLALVLHQLVAGDFPFEAPELSASIEAQYRARSLPLRRLERPEPSARILERILRRCLAVDPAQRYAKADELAEALDACAALRACEKELPSAGPLTRLAMRSPLVSTFVAGLLPNLIGAAVGCGYLTAVLMSVEPALVDSYLTALIVYGSFIFPVTGTICGTRALKLSRRLARIDADGARAVEAVELRRQLLGAPAVTAVISLLGWGLGIPFFPWFTTALSGQVISDPLRIHNCAFAALAGLISCAYTAIFVRHATLRLFLPWATIDGRDLEASVNLAFVPGRLRALQLLAATGLPTAAVLVLALWPQPILPLTRGLLGTLMWVGAMGTALALHSASEAIRCAEALERLRSRVAR